MLIQFVAGTLGGVYDADGDGDFDVEDAKVLLGECDRFLHVEHYVSFLHDQQRFKFLAFNIKLLQQ